MSEFLSKYKEHVEERAALGIVPLALDADQTAALIELIKDPKDHNQAELGVTLYTNDEFHHRGLHHRFYINGSAEFKKIHSRI